MIKSITEILRTFFSHILMIKRSRYKLKNKFEAFKVVNVLHLKSIILKNKKEITQKIFKFKVSAYDHGTLMFLFEEIFLSQDYYFFTEKKNPQIIDCGANIGMSTLYLKFFIQNVQ